MKCPVFCNVAMAIVMFGILLFATGCSTPVSPLVRYALPRPQKTEFFQSILAGQFWRSDGGACPTFVSKIEPTAPDIMYVEAILPNAEAPDKPFVSRKKVSKEEETVKFAGPEVHGWKPGSYYRFVLRIYEDPGYSHLLGTHEQEELCTEPAIGWAR